jgi:hypothetical protein
LFPIKTNENPTPAVTADIRQNVAVFLIRAENFFMPNVIAIIKTADIIEKTNDKTVSKGIKKTHEAYIAPAIEPKQILGILGVFLIKNDVIESRI